MYNNTIRFSETNVTVTVEFDPGPLGDITSESLGLTSALSEAAGDLRGAATYARGSIATTAAVALAEEVSDGDGWAIDNIARTGAGVLSGAVTGAAVTAATGNPVAGWAAGAYAGYQTVEALERLAEMEDPYGGAAGVGQVSVNYGSATVSPSTVDELNGGTGMGVTVSAGYEHNALDQIATENLAFGISVTSLPNTQVSPNDLVPHNEPYGYRVLILELICRFGVTYEPP